MHEGGLVILSCAGYYISIQPLSPFTGLHQDSHTLALDQVPYINACTRVKP
jgi:hypothetical protein